MLDLGPAEEDAAAVGHDGGSVQVSGVHDLGRDRVESLRRKNDFAALGADQPTVLDERVHGRRLHGQGHARLRVIEGQGEGVAGGERDRPSAREDEAGVADFRRHERDETPVAGEQGALVDDGAAGGAAAEDVASGHEIPVGDVGGGRQQSADLDGGAGREIDPIGIDEINPSVGRQVAEDPAGVGPDDAVERDGGGPGLDEPDFRGGADVEALPVHHGPLGRLVDGERGAVGAARADQGGLAGDDRPALRQRRRLRRGEGQDG